MSEKTKYVLEMDEEQAKILQKACEFYARVRMGQWQEVPQICLDLSDHQYIEKLVVSKAHLQKARKAVYPDLHGEGHSYGVGKFEDSDMAWELYEVVRHCQAWHNHPEGGIGVAFDKPMCFSGHPLAKCHSKDK